MTSLDIQRARYAYEQVREFHTQNAEQAKDYRSELRSAGTLIHQLGLAQTLAFLAGGKPDRLRVRGQLLGWLVQSPLTAALFVGGQEQATPDQTTEQRYFRLLNCDSVAHRLATDEALAVLLWLKRIAEGRWDDQGVERVVLAGA